MQMKKNKIYLFSRISLFLLLITGCCIRSYAQEVLTLEKAFAIGLENNFSIKIDEKNIAIAENNNTWANAGKTPLIDLALGFNNNLTNDNNPASFLRGTFYNGGLSATLNGTWVVYNGGRFRINKDQLELNIDQQRLNQEAGINDLLRIIYQQYQTVIFQKEQLGVLQQVLSLSRDRLNYELVKKDFGQSNAYNLTQFESAVITDSTSIVRQLNAIETAKRNLYQTLDVAGWQNYQFNQTLAVRPDPVDEAKLKDILSEENYTLKSLNMIARLNQLNTALTKTARKPTIALSASLGFAQNGFKFFADDPNTGDPFPFLLSNRLTGSLGANLNYNLYDGGQRKTDIQSAQLQEEIDQLSMLEAQAELNNQLDLLIANYNNQLDLLALADTQIELARRNLTITEERFKSGQLTSLDFRNVQIQFLNASLNKVTAIYDLLLTRNEVDWLVGRFGES